MNNKKIAVIYKTKYGSTKEYAYMLKEKLNADIYRLENITDLILNQYDTIIYGGGLYAVGILGIKKFIQIVEKLKDKRIIVFSVGASSSNEKVKNDVIKNNFNDKFRKKIEFYHLRGAFNYKKLSILDKVLMNMLKASILKKKKDDLTSDEKGLLDAFDNPKSWVEEKNIQIILEKM